MTLDLRSLAVFRMAVGLLLLNQSFFLSHDFDAFYRADGVSPPQGWNESLLGILVFGLIPVLGMALGLGLATRLSTLLGLISLGIVQEANPQILQGGDVLL